MKTFPIIYKRTATGAIQQWQAEIDGGRFRTISGQVDGKLVTSEWTVAKVTNQGRSNERLPEDQAIFEVDALYKKRLEKEYHKDIKDIDTVLVRLPMLAKDYNEHKHKIDFTEGVYTQPKLDGIRATACSKMLMSRNGKEHVGTPHILEALQSMFDQYPNVVLDGELYNHEYKEDFDSICSAVKKKKPTLEDIMNARDVIQYHVYDVFSSDDFFGGRLVLLNMLNEKYFKNTNGMIQLVPTYNAIHETALDSYYEEFAEKGYEGAMVRINGPYVNKRTDKLLKRKEFIDEEFIIEDIVSGEGNWTGYAKSALLQLGDGRTFSSGIKGTREYLAKVLEDKHLYIGKPATVKYFNRTPSGIPRFPVIKEFNREDNT